MRILNYPYEVPTTFKTLDIILEALLNVEYFLLPNITLFLGALFSISMCYMWFSIFRER